MGLTTDFVLQQDRLPALHLPPWAMGSHVLTVGAPQSGKTLLALQWLDYLRATGQKAVIYDPKQQFVELYYDQRRDYILNPRDRRFPKVVLCEDIASEAEAMAYAEAYIPERPRVTNDYFDRAARDILTYLFQLSPHARNPEDPAKRATALHICRWLRPEPLADLIRGTELDAHFSPASPQHAEGVRADLSLVATALRQIPDPSRCRRAWSPKRWIRQEGSSFLFLTSTPATRALTTRVQAPWINALILLAIEEQDPTKPPIAFVFDEFGEFPKMPGTTDLIAAGRDKAPTMLIVQDLAQVAQKYGDDVKVILAMCAVQVFMRLGDVTTRKWGSEMIGVQRIERLVRTYQSGGRGGMSEHVVLEDRPLVTPSDLGGLDARHGYLKIGNLVTPIHLPIIARTARAEKFVPWPDDPDREPPLLVHEDRALVEHLA